MTWLSPAPRCVAKWLWMPDTRSTRSAGQQGSVAAPGGRAGSGLAIHPRPPPRPLMQSSSSAGHAACSSSMRSTGLPMTVGGAGRGGGVRTGAEVMRWRWRRTMARRSHSTGACTCDKSACCRRRRQLRPRLGVHHRSWSGAARAALPAAAAPARPTPCLPSAAASLPGRSGPPPLAPAGTRRAALLGHVARARRCRRRPQCCAVRHACLLLLLLHSARMAGHGPSSKATRQGGTWSTGRCGSAACASSTRRSTAVWPDPSGLICADVKVWGWLFLVVFLSP